MQRQLFICEAIKDCKETSECCPHKIPHIKDERCVPKECRFGPVGKAVDCVLFDPAKPAEEQKPKEVTVEEKKSEPINEKGQTEEPDPDGEPEPVEEKPAEPAQRPVTLRKKPGRKASK
jgi:hypothetical protein